MTMVFSRMYNHYQTYGIHSLVQEVTKPVLKPAYLFACGVADRVLQPYDGIRILIRLRKDGFDAISISLLSELKQYENDIDEIVFCVRSKHKYEKKVEPIEHTFIDNYPINICVVETDTVGFVKKLISSNILIITSKNHFWKYRYISKQSKRLIVHVYHGVMTKAQGNLTEKKQTQEKYKNSTTIDPYPYGVVSRFDRTDVKTVASSVEKHFHAVGEARSPAVFKKWGYPRIDRIDKIKNSNDHGKILPSSAKNKLDSDNSSLKILYAPTHFDGEDVHTFRLPDFNFNKFVELLESHNISLYMRMHYNEESNKDYKKYLEHDRIIYAGYDFSPSPVEFLDQFDALITDYSSIYIDYLHFNNPIIFIDGQRSSFIRNRGIPFEYDTFFPGPKVKDTNELIREIERISNGIDQYCDDRELVKRVLLPEKKERFIEQLLSEANINRS